MPNYTHTISSLFLCICLLANVAEANDTISVKGDPVDHAILDARRGISKDQLILVRLFDTSNARPGKAKHQDIVKMLVHTAPHLLVADIVELLRDAGFTNILLNESNKQLAGDYMILEGEFTDLNPGSSREYRSNTLDWIPGLVRCS